MMTMMGMIVTNDDKRYWEVIKKIKIIMIMIKDIGRLLQPADSALPVQPRVRSWSRTPEYTNIIFLIIFQIIFLGCYIFYILVQDT